MKGDVLWPADVSEVDRAANDNSLVMRIRTATESFLLPGDIEKKVENELVAEHAPLAANFLKVPHHGSKTSSTDAFVGAVAPRVAVVSVGEGNQFGHPVDSVVERYARAGVRFLRTDRDGAVTALTDGQRLGSAYLCGRASAVNQTSANLWRIAREASLALTEAAASRRTPNCARSDEVPNVPSDSIG